MEKGPKIDLVLTPQFYLMARETLPLRFAFQARKLAPSILEEAGASRRMQYELYREGGKWYYFAYDPEEVGSFLKRRGVDPSTVGRLYFAQQFVEALDQPVLLAGGEVALVRMDGVVTIVSSELIENPKDLKTWTPPLPSRSFRLENSRYDGPVEWRVAAAAALAFGLIGLGWFAEGLRYHRKVSETETEIVKLLEEYPTLQSRLTRENILQRYKKVDTRQRAIRQRIREIGALVSKDSKLDELSVDEKGYRARISGRADKLGALRKIAEQKGLRPRVGKGVVTIEGSWQ